MRSDVVKSVIEIYDEPISDKEVERAIENTIQLPNSTVVVKTLLRMQRTKLLNMNRQKIWIVH